MLRALLAAEDAEGTSAGAVRIAVWVAIALAVAGLVGPGIYHAAAHAADCLKGLAC